MATNRLDQSSIPCAHFVEHLEGSGNSVVGGCPRGSSCGGDWRRWWRSACNTFFVRLLAFHPRHFAHLHRRGGDGLDRIRGGNGGGRACLPGGDDEVAPVLAGMGGGGLNGDGRDTAGDEICLRGWRVHDFHSDGRPTVGRRPWRCYRAGEGGSERAEEDQWRRREGRAGTAPWKCPSRQISLAIGVTLGSASRLVFVKVEGENLPRPAKFFKGRDPIRYLFGPLFSRKTANWRLFCSSA